MVGEVDKVLGNHVVVSLGRKVGHLTGPVFGGPSHEGSAKAATPGRNQVTIVSGYHHALLGRKAEELGGPEVGVRLRLVMPRDFGPENRVPGKPAVLCYVHQQRDVPVG